MKNLVTMITFAFIAVGCAHPGSKMDTNSIGDRRVAMIEITPSTLQNQVIKDRTELAQRRIRELDTENTDYVYRIGAQDILSITVWDHPELTIPAGEFRTAEAAGHLVAEDGTIFYPFLGKVRVSGLSLAEIRDVLTAGLSDQIRDPQLDVRIAAYRSQRAYIVGAVANPGVQPITDIALTVLEAISRAGDVTEASDMTNVTLTRDNTTYDIDLLAMYEYGDLSQNIPLEHGDVLSVPDRNLQKVFVLGAVAQPSTQIMHKGRLTLAEALSDAGGLNEKEARASAVYVIRGTEFEPEIYHLNAKSPGALILADQFKLAARDIVYVETSGEIRAGERLVRLSQLARLLRDFSDTSWPLFEDGVNNSTIIENP